MTDVRPADRFRLWPGAVILAALALLVIYRLREVLAPGNDRLLGLDTVNLYGWEIYTRAVLRTGALPHWNPFHFGGIPHLADTQTTVFYPPALLLRWLPPIPFFGWMAALHIWLAGIGMLVLARVVGLSWVAASAGAIGMMLGGSVAPSLHTGHLLVLYCTAWLPLGLALSIISVRRNTVLPYFPLAVVLLVQFLAGYLQGSIYFVSAVSLYFLYSAIWPETKDSDAATRWRPLVQLALLGLLTAGLTAFQLFPTAVLVAEAGRTSGVPYEFATRGTWSVADLGSFFFPFRNVSEEPPLRYMADRSAYVGWLLAGLAPLALVERRRRRLALFFAVLMATAVAFAFGDNLPFYRLHYALFPGLRVPGRVLILAALSLATLGAIGIELVVSRLGAIAWRRQALQIVALTVLIIDMSMFSAGAVHTVPVEAEETVRQWLGTTGGGRAVSLCEHVIGPTGFLIVGQPTVDGVGGVYLRDYADWAYLVKTGQRSPEEGIYHRIGSDGEWPARRDLLDLTNVTTLAACAPLEEPALDIARRESVTVYRNRTARPRVFWACGSEELSREAIAERLRLSRYDENGRLERSHPVINVRWSMSVSHERRRALEALYRLANGVQREGRTWRYELRDTSVGNVLAMVRDEAVEDTHGIDRQTGRLSAQELELQAGSPGGDEVLIGTAACLEGGTATVLISDRPDGHLLADIEAPTAGLVFMSEPHYAERRVTVDGEPVAPLKANLAFMAVPVEAGRHRLELRYVPRSLHVGLVTSLMTAVVWAGVLLTPRIRARKSIRIHAETQKEFS